MDLAAYYAENRRRSRIAQQEFAERTHRWRFGLSVDAAAWASSHPLSEYDLMDLVEDADAAGLFLKPEPGAIRAAFSTRHPETELTTGSGSDSGPPWPIS